MYAPSYSCQYYMAYLPKIQSEYTNFYSHRLLTLSRLYIFFSLYPTLINVSIISYLANCSILRAVCYQNIVAQGFHQHPNRIKGNYKYTFVPPSTFISHHNCQKRKHNRHSNIDVGRKTNNRCYSKLPNHEQRYTDHRQIPFSLTSKKYIEIKKE